VTLPRAGALLLLLSLPAVACSRPSGDAPRGEGSVVVPPAPPLTGSAAEGPAGPVGPVLTPEDVEPETERRITEQNLESELDRLEREIQAE
jgi:hypothetical protein